MAILPNNNKNQIKMKNFKIELEAKVKDTVTGFTGIVTGRIQYVSAGNSYCVEGHVTDPGTKPPVMWIEEYRLTIVTE
jgi:hypothetical protein